jgi:hypothetical protein
MATRKITSAKKKKPKHKPRLPWQIDLYSEYISEEIRIPPQLLLICKLLSVPPIDLITDFLDNASLAAWKRQGREAAREKVMEYILACGYGEEFYSEAEIRQLLKEADAQGMVWPKDADMKLLDASSNWRELYQPYWFNRWFWKHNRKL